ncbi:MAG: YopX family protein [Clostridium sp.]|nr:YopX family protein [Clostridium sp.]MDU7085637.1 YopX family protein [Clostridium sp.]
MREIKFRVWNEDTKEMLEIQKHSFKTNKSMPYGWNMQYEFDGLMQYTGLKDKHGKEIYEGDILTWQPLSSQDIECKGKVYYMNGSYWVKTKKIIAPYLGDIARYHNPEVIGNAFENPELLEG